MVEFRDCDYLIAWDTERPRLVRYTEGRDKIHGVLGNHKNDGNVLRKTDIRPVS